MLLSVVFLFADPYTKRRRWLFPGALYFIIILLAGARGIAGNAHYDVVKDLWYLGYPALTLLFGYQLAKRLDDLKSVLWAFVVAALIVSCVHISQFILNPSYLNDSLIEIRANVSSGYLIAAIGFGIIAGDLCFGLDLLPSKLISLLIMALCLLSITLSFSRTLWICVATLLLAALIIKSPRAALRIAIVVTVLGIMGVAATDGFKEVTEINPELTIIDKIFYSMKELQVSDYEDQIDINQNWRGFESYRALQTYTSGNWSDYLFGKGLGTNVELGFIMTLMDEDFDRIPVLHNGYMYLLVKTGAIGLSAYLLYLLLTLRAGTAFLYRSDPESRMSGFLLVALTLIMLVTTVVVAGMFNKYWFLQSIVLLGILMEYAERTFGQNFIAGIGFRASPGSQSREVL
jgi:O-antigen ligase